MITLLASIAGFLTSLVPEIVKFFKDKNDKKHEIDILGMQMKINKLQTTENLDDIRYAHYANEMQTLYSTYKTSIGWIDALNGSVRPIMAYCFFGLYASLKYIQYKTIIDSGEIVAIYFDMLWTTDDQAIFASIISFYFGQRAFSKIWRGGNVS